MGQKWSKYVNGDHIKQKNSKWGQKGANKGPKWVSWVQTWLKRLKVGSNMAKGTSIGTKKGQKRSKEV